MSVFYKLWYGTGDGDKFVDFISNFIAFLCEKHVIFANNVNFHCKSESAKFVDVMMKQNGMKYYLLPKYSPEFNP